MPFTPHGLTKVNFHLHRMEITKLLHVTFRFHHTDYRNCSVYTARNIIVPFTPHGLKKINFHLHCMEITKTSPSTFRFHCTNYRNCSVYTAWNTIVPFTPHGLKKVNFHLHRMETTNFAISLLRLHRKEYRNPSIFNVWNTIVPFTPHGLANVIFLFTHVTPHGNNNFSLSLHGLTKFRSAYAWVDKTAPLPPHTLVTFSIFLLHGLIQFPRLPRMK